MRHAASLIAAGILLLLSPCTVHSDDSSPTYQTQTIHGWTVHIREDLLKQDPDAITVTVKSLTQQLEEIVKVVPTAAVKELQKIPLWFSPEYPGVPPRAEYHPGAGWLRDNKRDPQMAKGVEFTNVRIFEQETKRMPNFTLHELAHGYHDRVLKDGFGNKEVAAAYERAKASALYDSVEQRFGDGRSARVRAYAMSNPMEYFAECSEAFFSTNDFFPFTQDELKKHDPEMFELLGTLWGAQKAVKSEKQTQAEVTPKFEYGDWKYNGTIWLLTTADGAHLPDGTSVEQFPVLVRLTSESFDFSQAGKDGADIRFASESGEPLAFQIEEWNADRGVADIWVRMPVVHGNSRQPIRVFWGNSAAKSQSDGAAVFNTSNGYVTVWHMNDSAHDVADALAGKDTGTTPIAGVAGGARHFEPGKGISAGEAIDLLPTGSDDHSTEIWFRPARTNATLIGWGNEQAQGKVVMQFRSPPHIQMDCYFSGGNVESAGRIPISTWTHVVHTYRKGEARIYVNGKLDGTNTMHGGPLNIQSPGRMYLGGWYNNFDFDGDLDEVRVSRVVRSPEWIRLQYENQKPSQSLVGHLVQPGNEFTISEKSLVLSENESATITAKAGGAQKVQWIEKRGGQESIVATNQFSYTLRAGRIPAVVSGSPEQSPAGPPTSVVFKAIYEDGVKVHETSISIRDDIPEPEFTLEAPAKWDGRQAIEVVPRISNLAQMQAKGAGEVHITWTVDDIAVIRKIENGRLLLKRSQGSGKARVTAAIDNGGAAVTHSITIEVIEPPPSKDPWIPGPQLASQQPQDHQFIAREGMTHDPSFGTVVYAGTLKDAADSVFVRVFANDQPFAVETAVPVADRTYRVTAKIKPGFVKYRTEFGTKSGDKETILHSADDIVCGDVYLICGQSNAVATDFGKENRLKPSEWVRTFGATAGDLSGSRLELWAPAEARSPGGKSEIGYWGMELGRRLVESEKVPICILNGAVGGTRIDQHQRNEADPTDVQTIYGRLLWRARQAGVAHGVRAIIWHQGENDQGADGPSGGYGYETYRQYFVDLAASWKEDYPNVQHYYMFQIWPRACAMGIHGSDNRLREVQRTLPQMFSNLSVIPTLGIKPPGGCHFPAAGYAEFARLLHPMIQYHIYHRFTPPFDAPNVRSVRFTSDRRDEIEMDFGYNMKWSDSLISEFHLEGEPKQIVSGSVNGGRITLKLRGPTDSKTLTYLDSAHWNPDNILYSDSGLAALTFCEVPIEPATPAED
ncbi:MAG: zinc-dependent peptidase [Planctomycetaceae bacterium]